jgi:hypothetical protein
MTVTFAGSNVVDLVVAPVAVWAGANVPLLDVSVGDFVSFPTCNACAILSRIAGMIQELSLPS